MDQWRVNDSVRARNRDKETTETESRQKNRQVIEQKTGQEYLQMSDWKIVYQTI